MTTIAPAIDYVAVGRTVVRGVRMALGLGDQQVIFLQPEDVNATRPALPYISVYFSTVSQAFGWDTSDIVGDDDAEQLSGPRQFTVDVESYAESHAEANGLITTLQATIFAQSICAYFRAQAGLAVYDAGNVTDDSKALDTGFEGRAKMSITFGVLSVVRLPSQGTIETATVGGSTLGDEVLTIGET